MSIRILIADDHGLLRAGLRALLNAEPDLDVVGEAMDGEQALKLTRSLQPDIVLMDISMPGCGGIEAAQLLTKEHANVRVLMLTVHEDTELLQEAIRSGAAGYIVKRAVESELVNAIRAVSRGDLYIHPVMTRALFSNTLPVSAEKPETIEELTPREVEILRLLAQGHINREIAQLLSLSIRTVESHRANILGKLNLHSRVELVRYAKERGLITMGND
jgi:two-component system response regulator NreC